MVRPRCRHAHACHCHACLLTVSHHHCCQAMQRQMCLQQKLASGEVWWQVCACSACLREEMQQVCRQPAPHFPSLSEERGGRCEKKREGGIILSFITAQRRAVCAKSRHRHFLQHVLSKGKGLLFLLSLCVGMPVR